MCNFHHSPVATLGPKYPPQHPILEHPHPTFFFAVLQSKFQTHTKQKTTLQCCMFLFLKIKPTRCNNYSNLFLEWNSIRFGQFLRPSSGVFHCTHSNGISHTGLLTACEQAVSKPVWLIPLLCVQWKTDDGRRNCPKHVEFHSKNKLEKLMHLVGFIIRNHTEYT